MVTDLIRDVKGERLPTGSPPRTISMSGIILDNDLKALCMDLLGVPHERVAEKLGQTRDIIRVHLGKMPELAKSPNADLKSC